MQSPNLLLTSSANLTAKVFARSYFISKRCGELFRVSDIKTLSSLSKIYRNTCWTIYSIISSLYKAFRLFYICSTTSAFYCNCIIVSVVFSAPPPCFCRPSSLTSATTEVMLYFCNYMSLFRKFFSAIFALHNNFETFLISSFMFINNFSRSTTLVKLVKIFTTAASAQDSFLSNIFHNYILSHFSKTSNLSVWML